jgi:hypothetical protein
VRLAFFQRGVWGDPTRSSVRGPALVQHTRVRLLPRQDRTTLVLTRLSTRSQVDLAAQLLGPGHTRLAVLPRGSRLGVALTPGRAAKTVRTRLLEPGGIAVRLRVNGRFLRHGARYRLRVTAVDPWGRSDVVVLPFRAP